MITEERVLDFIRSFGVDRGSEALHMIEKEAIRDDVPIIRKESRELLRNIAAKLKTGENSGGRCCHRIFFVLWVKYR